MSRPYEDEIARITEEIKADSFALEVKKGVLKSLERMAQNDRSEVTVIELGPTDAVKFYFDQNPDRDLRPKEIHTGLQQLIDEGKLRITTGKSPERFVRGVLANLRESKKITRIIPGSNKRIVLYRQSS